MSLAGRWAEADAGCTWQDGGPRQHSGHQGRETTGGTRRPHGFYRADDGGPRHGPRKLCQRRRRCWPLLTYVQDRRGRTAWCLLAVTEPGSESRQASPLVLRLLISAGRGLFHATHVPSQVDSTCSSLAVTRACASRRTWRHGCVGVRQYGARPLPRAPPAYRCPGQVACCSRSAFSGWRHAAQAGRQPTNRPCGCVHAVAWLHRLLARAPSTLAAALRRPTLRQLREIDAAAAGPHGPPPAAPDPRSARGDVPSTGACVSLGCVSFFFLRGRSVEKK